MEVGQPYPYKGFWIRLVAALIDGIVLAIIVIFLAAAMSENAWRAYLIE